MLPQPRSVDMCFVRSPILMSINLYAGPGLFGLYPQSIVYHLHLKTNLQGLQKAGKNRFSLTNLAEPLRLETFELKSLARWVYFKVGGVVSY